MLGSAAVKQRIPALCAAVVLALIATTLVAVPGAQAQSNAPGAPNAPTLTGSSGSLAVSWSAPSNTGGSAITDYQLRYRKQGQSNWQTFYDTSFDSGNRTTEYGVGQNKPLDLGTVSMSGVTITREVLGGGAVYKVGTALPRGLRIRVKATAGNAAAYNIRLRYASNKPTTSNLNSHGTQLWDHFFHVALPLDRTGTTNALTAGSYFWVAADNSGSNGVTTSRLWLWAETASTATSATIGGLDVGKDYEAQVKAWNANGGSAWSATAVGNAGDPPDAPAAPTLLSGNRQLGIGWSAPADTGDSDVSDYDVRYRACTAADTTCSASPSWGAWTETPDSTDSTATSATVTGLTNGTAYQVQVRAANAAGNGAWSPSAQETVGAPEAPAAPAFVSGNRQLAVRWTAPADSGSAITDYDVRYRKGSSGAWTSTPDTTDSIATTVTLTGLDNNAAYQVQVRAQNARAPGAWVTGTATPRDVPLTPPAPRLSPGNGRLIVSWDAPADNASAVADYDVRYCAGTSSQCPSNDATKWTEWRSADTSTARTATVTMLVNGTRYQVQVRAGSTVGSSAWSSSSADVAGRAGPPTGLGLVPGSSWFTASWTAAAANGSAITDYDVRYRACTAVDTTCASSPAWEDTWTNTPDATDSTATSASVTSLTAGTAYQVQTRAQNAHGASPWTSSATVTVGVPSAPAAPSVAAGDRRVTVTWAAPAANGSAITDYDVRYSADNGVSWTQWQPSVTSTAISATVTGLTTGATYVASVRAGNARGDGAWSPQSAGVTLTAAPATPDAPTLTVASGQIGVSWEAPSNNGSAITDYDVRYRACTATDLTCATSPAWGDWAEWNASDTGTATTAAITSLTDGTAYQVQVRATNAAGDSDWSASAAATPGSNVPPNAPRRPVLSPGNAQVAVAWTAPADNGDAIDDYDVRYRTCTAADTTCATSPTWGNWKEVFDGGTMSRQIVDKRADQSPINCGSPNAGLSVINENFNGNSGMYKITADVDRMDVRCWVFPFLGFGADTTARLRWATSKPDTSANLFTVGTQLATITQPSGNWYGFNFSGSYGPFEAGSYFWYAANRSQTYNTRRLDLNVDLATTAASSTVTGLANGTGYQVQVRAGNSRGDGGWSPAATATAGTPALIAAPALVSGNQQITVDWAAPSGNGSAVTDYDVRYSANNGATWLEWNAADTGTTVGATITRLTNGTAYLVQVRATNAHGDSPWSPSAVATAGAPEAPAVPALVSGNASLTATWTAPADNGSTVTDYDLRYSSDSGATWTVFENGTSTATSATVTGLVNGTSYIVAVRAANARDDGAWSSASSALKAGLPAAPAAPVLSSGATQLSVSWAAPSANGSTITDYDVRYCSGSSTQCDTTDANDWTVWQPANTSTARSAAVTGLTNGTTYQVQARAANTHGEGPWSPVAGGIPGGPARPAAPALAPANASLTASWTAPAANGSSITDYDLRYSSDSGATWTVFENGTSTATAATIPGLVNGTSYIVAVRAANARGDGSWSPASAALTAGAPARPAAPALAPGNASVTASWAAPAANGSAVTDYDVRYRKSGATAWTDVVVGYSPGLLGNFRSSNGASGQALDLGTVSLPGAAITKVTTGGISNVYRLGSAVGRLRVKLRGRNAKTNTTLVYRARYAPTAPTTSNMNTHGTLLWEESVSYAANFTVDAWTPSLAAGTHFWITTTADGRTDIVTPTIEADDITSTSLTQQITGLTNGEAYEVQVRAGNARGDGPWSPTSAAVTPGTPAAPTALSLTTGDQQFAASWTVASDNGSAITENDLRYRRTGTTAWTLPFDRTSGPSGPGGIWVTGLGVPLNAGPVSNLGVTVSRQWLGDNGILYKVEGAVTGLRIRVSGSQFAASSARTIRLRYASSAPTGSNLNTHGTELWSASLPSGGSFAGEGKTPALAANSYFWIYGSNGGSESISNISMTIVHHAVENGTTGTVTGLTNGHTYEAQVRSMNARGDGPWSPSTSITVGVPAAPLAPTLVSANASLSAAWTAPAANGSAVTDYDLRYRACTATAGVTTDKTCTASPMWSDWTTLDDTGNNAADAAVAAAIADLANGTAYQVQVRAGNANGDGAWSPSATDTPGKPTAPAAPSLAPGNTQIAVSWTAPAANGSAITDYDVRYSSDGGANWTEWNAADTGTATSATITGLTNGTSYQVQARATNAVGDSGWSASATLKAGLPAAPAKPTLVWSSTQDSAQIAVSWTAPAANGSAITDYDVRYSTDGAAWTEWNAANTSTAISTTITGLTGTSYWVQVRAANAAGDGAWSSSATTGVPPAPAPVLVSGNGQLTVSWDAPAGIPGITDYDVRYRACTAADTTCTIASAWAGSWTSTPDNSNSTALSATLASLTNGTAYQVQVRAGNANGDGPWSSSAALTAGLPAPPAAPTLAAASAQLTAAWTAPAANGSAVTDYDVRYRAAGATSWTHTPIVSYSPGSLGNNRRTSNLDGTALDLGAISLTGVTVTKVTTGGTSNVYKIGSAVGTLRIKLRARNAETRNVTYQARYAATAPALNTINTHGTLLWEQSVAYAAYVNGDAWTPPLPAGSHFWIMPVPDGQADVVTPTIQADDITSVSLSRALTGLTNGTTYEVQVRAANTRGESAWSPSASLAAGAPSAPVAPTLGSGDARLTVAWPAPAANGSAITGYTVQHSTDGAVWSSAGVTVTAATRTAEIAGLANGTAYRVRARAVNARGHSPWSPSATRQAGAPTAPAAPALASGDAQLGVSWVAPAANGSAITDYDVRYSSDGGSTWAEWQSAVTSTATSATITQLTNGTAYQVQVRAGNARGDGLWSPSATLKAGLPSPPAAPALVSGDAQLGVSWVAPAANGSAITDYDVRYSSDGGSTWAEWQSAVTSTATSATITQLTNGTAYRVQVRAGNARGDGVWSPSAASKAGLPAAPAAPGSIPQLSAGAASLTVTWAAPDGDGSSIVDYDVRYSSDGGMSWTEWMPTQTSTATSATITGLTSGSTYQVQVRAANLAGEGAWSPSASMSLGAPGTIASVSVTRSAGALTASWPAVPGAAWYHVVYSSDGLNSWTLAAYQHATAGIEISGANDGATYVVAVRAGNDFGWGGWRNSEPSSATLLPPGTVSSVSVTRSDGMLSVSWPAVATATKYHVTYSSDGGSNWALAAFDHASASIEIAGADSTLAYVVAVRAGNAAGWGGWRNSPSAAATLVPPGQVSSVSVSRSDGVLSVSWPAPPTATKYHVTYSSDGGATWALAAAEHASASIDITGADNSLSYVVGVRAGNAAGWGGWRNSASAGPWWPSNVPPAAPASVSLSRECGKPFVISWAPVVGATGYDMVSSKNGRKSWQRLKSNTPHTSWVFTTFSHDKPYTVAVRALNAAGHSTWTNSPTVPPPSCN